MKHLRKTCSKNIDVITVCCAWILNEEHYFFHMLILHYIKSILCSDRHVVCFYKHFAQLEILMFSKNPSASKCRVENLLCSKWSAHWSWEVISRSCIYLLFISMQLSRAPQGPALLRGALTSLEDTNSSEKSPDKVIFWSRWHLYYCILKYKTHISWHHSPARFIAFPASLTPMEGSSSHWQSS